MIIQSHEVSKVGRLDSTAVVIGAGPAGIASAMRLAEAGLDTILLESGGLEQSPSAQRLSAGENVGRRTWPLGSSRARAFGGSGNRWGGMCRPFDDSDLQARPFVDGQAWPVAAGELRRFHHETAEMLGLRHGAFGPDDWQGVTPAPLTLDDDFDNVIFQFSPTRMSMGAHYRTSIAASTRTRLVTDATVTGIHLHQGSGTVSHVEVADPTGHRFRVYADHFILAAGTIENARLLLASNSQRPAGLGNQYDQVGRHFMDHLHVDAGWWIPATAAHDRSFYALQDHGRSRVRGLYAVSERAQLTHGLPAACLAVDAPVHQVGQPFLGWPSAVTLPPERAVRTVGRIIDEHVRGTTTARTTIDPDQRRATRLGLRAGGQLWYTVSTMDQRRRLAQLRRSAGLPRGTRLHSLYLRSEQSPNPSSRVGLGRSRDRFGTPVAQLDWQLAARDIDGAAATIEAFAQAVMRGGLGRVVPPMDEAWESRIIAGPHHMGTTRMSTSPRDGVVDADCRVHSITNLSVAGASVFPTGGYANPMFTLLTVSLRVAQNVVEHHRAGR